MGIEKQMRITQLSYFLDLPLSILISNCHRESKSPLFAFCGRFEGLVSRLRAADFDGDAAAEAEAEAPARAASGTRFIGKLEVAGSPTYIQSQRLGVPAKKIALASFKGPKEGLF